MKAFVGACVLVVGIGFVCGWALGQRVVMYVEESVTSVTTP